ncbi:MAG: ABC transporter ATP-binding protein [Caldisericota bacterium]|nr:ABC transporter ATP-binding protein [Caldisericota bacterium]
MHNINIKGLCFSYGENNVLNNLDLEIKENGVYCLIGKNGSGKTTLLKILIKFLPYKKGSISINEKDLSLFALKEISQTIGFLESEMPNIPLSIEEIISWGNFPFEKADRQIQDVVNELDLESIKDKNFLSLSTGERKRVLLGRIFAQSPDIVLIDEPFNFLDPKYKIEVSLLLKKLGEKSIVFIATHDIEAVQFVSKKAFVLSNGKIKMEDTPEKVIKSKFINEAFDIPESLRKKFEQFYHTDANS